MMVPMQLGTRASLKRIEDQPRAATERADKVERALGSHRQQSLFKHPGHPTPVPITSRPEAPTNDDAGGDFSGLAAPRDTP